MQHIFRTTAFLIGAVMGSILPALAQQSPPIQQPAPPAATEQKPFSFTNDVDVEFHPDGRVSVVNHYRGKVLSTAGVQTLGTFRDNYNAHYSTWEMIEAFTVKPDGRRVPVDPAKIIVQAAPASPDALHFFVDVKAVTVIFPELEVGDMVEGKFRSAQKQAFLPGGASWGWSFPRSVRRSGATITVRAAQQTGLKIWQNGLDHVEEVKGGQVVHTFRYTERPFVAHQADSVSAVDFEPTVIASTFPDWSTVARAFWDRGAGKSDPTPAVTAKAREITLGITDPRKKAEAVFNWVSEKVRYVNIVLGAGGWVPRDADSILSNLFGDCKDHVTLMRAMLRALDIRADYALVNEASTYKPYPIPVGWFDHIILHLPDQNSYVDPTNRFGQFGETDFRLQGKPVLRFNGESASFSVIPRIPAARNHWAIEVDLVVAPDGKVSGRNRTIATGAALPSLRSRVTGLVSAGLEASATRYLTSTNWRGKGTYTVDANQGRKETFIFGSTFELGVDFRSQRNGGTRYPLGPLAINRPTIRLGNLLRDNAYAPFTCLPFRWQETINVRLPEGGRLVQIPEPSSASTGKVSYTSRYEQKGDVLTVTRDLIWDAEEIICTSRSLNAYRTVLQAMGRDVNRARLVIAGLGTPAPASGQNNDDLE
jgi:hypothetical protein